MQEVPSPRLIVRTNRPLIEVPVDTDGGEAVVRPPIKLAGAWADLDAEAMLDALDRIRQQSARTAPISMSRAPGSRGDANR